MEKELEYVYSVQKEVSLLEGSISLLQWDEETYMPKNGVEERSEQTKFMEDILHSKLTSQKLYSALCSLKEEKLAPKDALVIKELDKQVTKLRKLPTYFVTKLSKESVISTSAWSKAREKNDFSVLRPNLEKIVFLMQKKAKFIDPNVVPYDVILNEYEEGMTTEKLTKIFEYLREELSSLLTKIKSTEKFNTQKRTKINLSKDILRSIIPLMDLSPESVYVGSSNSSFSTVISNQDVRIAIQRPFSVDSFFSLMHEAGHALYLLGLPEEYKYTKLHDSPSTGIDESQSLFWEKIIARSSDFWRGYTQTFRRYIPEKYSWNDLYQAFNQVRPSFIRVNADEVTYCLHVILRFEIERDLINGALKVEDAKEQWNQKMKELLGITPRSDNEGILQDIHWAEGLFGYFPTYVVGAIYASQIYDKMSRDIPTLNEDIQKLNFSHVREWLREKIHKKGKTKLAEEVIKDACGKGLDPGVFVEYLYTKYSRIYGLV